MSLGIHISGRKITGQSYVQHAAAANLSETADILEFLRNEDYDLMTNGSFYLVRNPGTQSFLLKSDLPDQDTFERHITISNAQRNNETNDLYIEGGELETYYLHDDGSFDREDPEDLMDSVPPTASTLVDYDEDDEPGLIIQKGYAYDDLDYVKYHDWILTQALAEDMIFDDSITFGIWTAMKDFNTEKTGVVATVLFDAEEDEGEECEEGEDECQIIATKIVTKSDWPVDSYTEVSFVMDNLNYTVPAGHYLILRMYVDNSSDDDMWFAYDTTSYSSSGTVSDDTYEDPNTKKIDIEILWAPDYIPLDLISQTFFITDWQKTYLYQ